MPSSVRQQLRRFLQQDSGATLTEYALLVSMVAVAAVVAANSLGTSSSTKMSAAGNAMTASAGAGGTGSNGNGAGGNGEGNQGQGLGNSGTPPGQSGSPGGGPPAGKGKGGD